ncbi:hypothetical protein B0H13DRAFT_1855324 [Mycena leptocephala]|nr:hypothetical protein B0H13DRAFT_1855324 [Mycena leptocephala]
MREFEPKAIQMRTRNILVVILPDLALLPPHGLLGCPNSYQGSVSFYPKNRPGITPLEPEFSSESDQGFTRFGRVFIRIENFGGQAFGSSPDDKDIPLPEVVDRVLRVRVRNAACRYVARCAVQAEGESGLSAADAEEDIWAYHPQGQLWTKARIPAEEKWSPEDENTGDDYYEPGDDD